MAFDPSFADAALQAGYSKEEVAKYAAQQDPFVRDALKAGYNFDDVLTHLKQGGEQTNEAQIRNEPETKLDNRTQRQAQEQVDAVGGEANVQADGLLRTEDQGQRQRNDQASQRQRNSDSIQLSGSQVAQGGELNANEENAKAENGYGPQVGKEDGQGVRSQEDARNKAQVTGGGEGVRPSSTQSKVIAGLGSLAESAAQLAGFHFGGKAALSAATKFVARQGTGALLGELVVAPIAAVEEVFSGGLATPLAIGTEVLGGLAGGWIADKLEGLAERLTGTHGDIEKAKQENPLLSQVVNYSVMAPLAFKSTANLIKLAQKEGVGAAAGAAGIGAGLGAATYPLQVGMDKALNYLTGQTDEEKMSWKGLLENAAIGGILGGAGLPETAKVEEGLNTIRLTNKKIKEDAKDPNFVVENAFSQVEKHIENGDTKSAQEALERAKAIKEANPATGEVEENRNHRQEFLDQQIKSEEKPKVSPITKDASDLLDKLDQSGSTLGYINNNVARILRENGINVTDKTTPEEAIQALRNKAKQPTEETTDATKIRKVKEGNIPEYQEGDQGRQAPEAGGGDRIVESRQEPKEVAPWFVAEPQGERIAAAAYRDPETGIVHEGEDHQSAETKAGKEPIETAEGRETQDHGFTTDKGEFVTREKAQEISEKSGQFLGKKTDRPVLHSNEVELDDHPSPDSVITTEEQPKFQEGMPTLEQQAKNIRSRQRTQGGFADQSILKDVYEYGARLVKKGMSFGAWSKKMVSSLGNKVKEVLGKIWTHLKENWNKDISGSLGSKSDDFAKRVLENQNAKNQKTEIQPEEPIETPIAGKKEEPIETPEVKLEVSKDPLEKLTQDIKEKADENPKASIVDLAKEAEKISQEISAGKDAFTRGLNGAKAAFEGVKNAYLNRPTWTDFKKALGEWSFADNDTSIKVMRYVKEIIKSVPNKLRREAITNYIQAGGDEALLRERANASKPKYKKGYEAALTLTDAEKAHANDISKYLSDMLEEGINSGMLNHGIENYITQVWKKENPVTKNLQASLQGGKLNKNFQFAKKRVFDSYFEGEQAGYEPASKDVASLIAAYDLSFRKTEAVRAFVKNMLEGKAEDGKPLVQLSGYAQPVGEEGAPPNAYLIKPQARPEGAVTEDGRPYVSINHPAFKGWKWTMNGPDGKPVIMESDMMVHPDIATDIKNLTEKSWFKANRIPLVSSAVDGLLKFSSILKQTKLSLSLFHLDQEGLHSLFHRINPANLEEINLKDEKQKGLVLGGLQLADYNSQELFSEGLAGGGLVGKVPVIGKLQNWFNDFLFKDYIPKLKMNMATHALDRNIQRYGDKLTKEQIYELTADQANAAFGELNYKMMARNQTVQDTLRLFLLAPDFLEARSRFVAQALKPYGAEQRAALALMGASLYVAGRVLNQVLDGDPHYDKPFSIFHEGREYRLRTVLGDVSELVDKPNTFFMNRLSPVGRTGVEFLTGRDSRGIKRNAVEQAEDFLSWFVPIPAQASPSTTTGSQILSSIGLSNYQHMTQTDVYDAANKWLKSQQDPRIQAMVKKREESTLAESDYKQLKSALLADNMDFAKRELARLINEKGKTPQDFARSLNVRKPFTGSNAMERAFISSLNDEQKNQYNKALQERSLIAERFNQLLSQ